MKPEPVFHLMNKYGTDVKMNYDTNNYEGISLKPGAMSCTESEVQDLPYRGIIANRRVPITVVGRVSLYAVMSTVIVFQILMSLSAWLLSLAAAAYVRFTCISGSLMTVLITA
jgi:hypothetical protein